MEAVTAAPPAMVESAKSPGKPRPTMGTRRPERVSEEPSFAAANFADRARSGRRRRRQPAETVAGFRSVVGLLALAVGFAVAVSSLHRLVWCLQGVSRQKRSMGRSPGVFSRRLVPVEDTQEGVPDLPTYDQALGMPSYPPWDAPPPYSESDQQSPPPYEEACSVHVWTVIRPPAQTSPPHEASPTSTLVTHSLELALIFIWLLGAGLSVALLNLTNMDKLYSVLIGVGVALSLTVVLYLSWRKVRFIRELDRGNGPGPVEV